MWVLLFPHIKRVQSDTCFNPDNNLSSQHHKCCSGWIKLRDSLITSVWCFQLCLCPACLSCCLPPKILLFCLQQTELSCFWTHPVFSLCSCRCRNDICRGTLFRPLRLFCKVRYVNWPLLPLQNTCMCCMWAANQSLHTASHPRLILLLFYCFTNF